MIITTTQSIAIVKLLRFNSFLMLLIIACRVVESFNDHLLWLFLCSKIEISNQELVSVQWCLGTILCEKEFLFSLSSPLVHLLHMWWHTPLSLLQ